MRPRIFADFRAVDEEVDELDGLFLVLALGVQRQLAGRRGIAARIAAGLYRRRGDDVDQVLGEGLIAAGDVLRIEEAEDRLATHDWAVRPFGAGKLRLDVGRNGGAGPAHLVPDIEPFGDVVGRHLELRLVVELPARTQHVHDDELEASAGVLCAVHLGVGLVDLRAVVGELGVVPVGGGRIHLETLDRRLVDAHSLNGDGDGRCILLAQGLAEGQHRRIEEVRLEGVGDVGVERRERAAAGVLDGVGTAEGDDVRGGAAGQHRRDLVHVGVARDAFVAHIPVGMQFGELLHRGAADLELLGVAERRETQIDVCGARCGRSERGEGTRGSCTDQQLTTIHPDAAPAVVLCHGCFLSGCCAASATRFAALSP